MRQRRDRRQHPSTRARPSRLLEPCAAPVAQRGVVLFIAMIASVAMALAAAALVRAVSTSVAIGDNLDTRQRAVLAASAAVERSVAALFETGALATIADDPSRNYFAARLAGEDARGVPSVLQSLTAYPADMAPIDVGDGYAVRYVIERLCVSPGDATLAHCTLSPPSIEAASGTPPAGEPPRTPSYRVSVRVDGPKAATAFVQALLSSAGEHRLAWRVLGEW